MNSPLSKSFAEAAGGGSIASSSENEPSHAFTLMISPPDEKDDRSANEISRCQLLYFFALCLLGSSTWIIDAAWPSTLADPQRQALRAVLAAAILSAVGSRSHRRKGLQTRPWLKLAAASVLLLGLPSALAAASLQGVSGITATALFALTPVAVVIIASQAESNASNRTLPAALVGLAGALLLLPIAYPASWRAAGNDGVVLIVVAVAASASFWLNRLLASFRVLEAAPIIALANALFLVALALLDRSMHEWRTAANWTSEALTIEALKAIFFDLPQLLLMIWLLRVVSPVRFAARYLAVPLFTVIEGFLLLRPQFTFKTFAGVALLAFGAWRLLTAQMQEEEPTLVLH